MSDVTAPPPARPLRELLPNLVWEGVLLLVAAGVLITLYNEAERLFSSGGYWLSFAALGLAAAGLSLSLRTGTPNLAVGPLASLAAYVYADSGSMLAGIAAAAGIGLVLALLVGLTGLPGWTVTLFGGLICTAIVIGASDARTTRLQDPPQTYWVWGVGFIVVSIAGGVVFAIPAVRRYLSANRPAGGEAGAFSGARFVGALVGVFGSSVAAGLAGAVLTIRLASAGPGDNNLTLGGLAVVLLAGVSPLGRRGGILGVVLAVAIVDGLTRLLQIWNQGFWGTMLVMGLLGLFGGLVVWLMELIGRRMSPLVTARPAGPAATPVGGFPPPGAGGPGFPPPYQGAPPVAGYPAGGYPGQPQAGQPAPVGQPGFGQLPAGSPPGTAPMYVPPPASGPVSPASAPPVSAPPTYAAPVAPASAPPASGPPASAPPASGAPASGAPDGIPPWPGSPPPASGPSWPPAR
ncbi:hypothetical protein [Dactylosporangium matsuzakiense]|uniref:Monosaccharide ABC transporter membrane protein (CUT2 family) n=1 Tax=Dactylosporangium matsuzakiense TaxID=53360 RepID=A0A9W6NL67_9ACTN|nr:hypothetical protein [Dactylosporangium matsuzakiense]UWZ48950.1 hypothetical protein Dmats_22675 [Dactylosporangium matsuzakiense]GLL00821.1 hypothetical protein GCM10017581_025620 [Dactylosporangium matsuzakiense]